MVVKKHAKFNEELDGDIKSLVEKLRCLTAEDKILWEDKTSPVINNHFVANYKGLDFYTEWLQDDNPELAWKFEQIFSVTGSVDLWDGSLKHQLVSNLIEEIKKQKLRLKDNSKTGSADFKKDKIKHVLRELNK